MDGMGGRRCHGYDGLHGHGGTFVAPVQAAVSCDKAAVSCDIGLNFAGCTDMYGR